MPRKIPRMTSIDAKANKATISFDGNSKELPASRWKDGQWVVHGFAASFEMGSKVWPASVTFEETVAGIFSYRDVRVSDFRAGKRQGSPPHVIGFLDESNPDDRGTPQGERKRPDWLRPSRRR